MASGSGRSGGATDDENRVKDAAVRKQRSDMQYINEEYLLVL